MTGWSFFFMLMGISYLTSQLFYIIDLIERPARRSRSRALAR